MSRAYEFYRHSALLLERTEADAAEQGRGRRLWLLAALANNMAHVSVSFFLHNRARSSLTLPRNLVDDEAMDGFFHGSMADDEIDLFTMNWVFSAEWC
jgi:hypothetical protein